MQHLPHYVLAYTGFYPQEVLILPVPLELPLGIVASQSGKIPEKEQEKLK
jgi:hypothetical protein